MSTAGSSGTGDAAAIASGFQDRPAPALIATIAVYAVLWIVSFVLAVVFTRREAAALSRSILLLKDRLSFLLSQPLPTDATLAPAPPPTLPAVAVAPSVPLPQPLPLPIDISDGNFNDNKESKNNHNSLLIPSTPETKNLLLSLAAGSDVVDELSLSIGPPLFEESDPIDSQINFMDSMQRKKSQAKAPGIMDSPIWSRSNSRIHHQHHHQQSHPSTTPASGPPIALKPTTSRVSTESFDMPPSERVRNMSLLSRAESVMFKPANGERPLVFDCSDSRPLLLLRASTVPRIPGLWRRMFKISSAKFLPEDIDSSARHAPGSPDYARFAAPQLPASPLAARVHRLILAAIDADLRVLECRFKKDAVRFPPVVYTFIGFQLLAMFLFIFGIGQSGWPIGLPLVLFIMACSLGFHILFSVLIRDMLTDLKAEHAVLVLSIRRVAARAPYHLSFSASTYVHKLSLSEWIVFTPLVALFSIWAIPLARRLFRIDEVPTQCRVLMSAPPPSLGGAIGFDHHELNTKSANADRFVILNGTVRPTVWNVVAELRVPPAGEAGASIEVGVESAVRKGPRVASDQTFVP